MLRGGQILRRRHPPQTAAKQALKCLSSKSSNSNVPIHKRNDYDYDTDGVTRNSGLIRSRPLTTTTTDGGPLDYFAPTYHQYHAFRIRTLLFPAWNASSRRSFSAIPLLPPMNNDNDDKQKNDEKQKRKTAGRTKNTISLLPPYNNNNSNNNNNNNNNDKKGKDKKNSAATARKGRRKRRRTSTRERSPPEDGTKKLSRRGRRKPLPKEYTQREVHAKGENPARLSPSHKNSIEGQLWSWYSSKNGVVQDSEESVVLQKAKLKRKVHIANKQFSWAWKARFTCPNTGESFDCGLLKDLPDAWIKQPTEEDRKIEEVAYLKASNARRAVLARALDCFRFRDDPETVHERLCEEMPYGADQDAAKVSPYIKAKDDIGNDDDDDDKEKDDTTPHSFETGNEDFDIDSDEYISEDDYDDDYDDEEDDDDEEYTITYLPGTAPGENSQQAAPNPLARVIEGWSDTTVALQSEMKFVPVLIDKPPEMELAKLVKNANDWIEQELPSENMYAGSAHRVMLQSTSFTQTLDIANSILKGLARAHSRVNFQTKSRGVEEVATKIVFHLWTTMSAQPNADTYAAYLACLEGPDSASVAIRANKVLEDMKNKAPVDASIAKGRNFPEPSIGVVNATIQLRAQMGGESGMYTSFEEIEHPNRDTFLSILSCMSYPPSVNGETGGFDPIVAQDCIDAMQAVADKHPEDQSLSPDLQVYNAGLRWSGGVQSTLSRPYARPLLWDSHEDIFKDGFQPFDEDDKSVQDAYRMHAWLEEMAGLGGAITPNVETYEAVIQAYIRTGTQEGIQQAEILLDSLLDSSSYNQTLRMQTFHPVIAAWAYSGHEEGPAKVNKWISRLEALDEEAGCNVQVDSRVREAPLLAHARRMTTMLESKKDFGYMEIEELIDTAHGCTLHLKDMCARLRDNSVDKQSATLLDAQMFVLVLRAWGKLGLHFLETNEGPERIDLVLGKMYETVEEYEGLILSLQKKTPKHDNGKIQLQHMTRSAHKVYAAFLATLSESANLKHPTDSTWTQGGQISSIERWVRRVDEFGRINISDEGEDSGGAGEFLYSDMYSYVPADSVPDNDNVGPSQFLKEVLKYLKNNVRQSLSLQRRGDLIRLSYLTMDLLSMQTDQSSLTSSFKDMEAIFDVAYDISSRPEEREALLGRLLSRVEWIQENKTSSSSSRNFADDDHESAARDIRNHASFPKGSAATAGKQANARRAFRRRSGRSRSSRR